MTAKTKERTTSRKSDKTGTKKGRKTPGKKNKAEFVPEAITINGTEYILIPKDEYYADDPDLDDSELVKISEDILRRERHLAVPFDKAIADILGEE